MFVRQKRTKLNIFLIIFRSIERVHVVKTCIFYHNFLVRPCWQRGSYIKPWVPSGDVDISPLSIYRSHHYWLTAVEYLSRLCSHCPYHWWCNVWSRICLPFWGTWDHTRFFVWFVLVSLEFSMIFLLTYFVLVVFPVKSW